MGLHKSKLVRIYPIINGYIVADVGLVAAWTERSKLSKGTAFGFARAIAENKNLSEENYHVLVV